MSSDFEQRFGGIARLYGAEGLRRLHAAHVCVVGIGGVGSWAVEALARSGVGALTLVDLDEVCVSNVNRQIHAFTNTVGQSKVGLMAERVRAINPECRVQAVQEFFTETNAERLLEEFTRPARTTATASGTPAPPWVIDAIDNVTNKTLLIALCFGRGIPVIACGGAGGRRDATAVRMADLSKASHDRLLAEVRRRLRKQHGFPSAEQPMGVDCVFSLENQVFPQPDGSVCGERPPPPKDEAPRLNCDWGLGSATFVTGAFGFAAAGHVVRKIAGT